jgi:phenylacetaldehyde dehydrogenase
VFADVANDMTFAPARDLRPRDGGIPFDDDAEPIAMANDSNFGPCSAIWTRDVAGAHRVAGQLEIGMVWINDHHGLDGS